MHILSNQDFTFMQAVSIGYNCIKCQILFSGKNKKNISICCLLKILPKVLRVKLPNQIRHSMQTACVFAISVAEIVGFLSLRGKDTAERFAANLQREATFEDTLSWNLSKTETTLKGKEQLLSFKSSEQCKD